MQAHDVRLSVRLMEMVDARIEAAIEARLSNFSPPSAWSPKDAIERHEHLRHGEPKPKRE
jgi:hypothetical protein